ncbi:signal peptidase I [Streptacidiphilus cavernicola]|uniref:Signal peptidase I n=1 Tax=Streptacidiphilus cavernicola TaxID=3342716 RepID=A0ABV6W397_9ACTN
MGTRGRSRQPSPSAAGSPTAPAISAERLRTADAGAPAATGDRTPGARAERGRAERRRAAKRASRRRKRSLLREIPLIVVVALAITLLLQTFLVQVFSIPSGSMQSTIGIGDRVVVNKLSPWFGAQPKRGDVVVFNDPDNWLKDDPVPKSGPVLGAVKTAFTFVGLLPSDRDLIKRVIGVPGDTVACCDSQGRLLVNGKPLDEPYVFPGNPPSRISFKVTVPAGKLWVMGDHRDVSADSRYHMSDATGGFVPEKDVVGRAVAVIWPLSHWRTLPSQSIQATAAGPPGGAVGAAAPPAPDQSLRQVSSAAALGPLPGELPLVMGLAATLSRTARRRWARRFERM